MNQVKKQGSLQIQKHFDLNKHRASYFKNSTGTDIDKINSLTRFMNRQDLAKLFAQKELLNKTQGFGKYN